MGWPEAATGRHSAGGCNPGLRAGDRLHVELLGPQGEAIPNERTAQRRTARRAVGRPIRQIDDDVGGVPGPARTHGKAGIMGRNVGLASGVEQPPQPPGRKIERAQRGLAVKENGTPYDLGLPGTSQRREENLTGVSLDLLSAERRSAQSRISSTDSTWTPFSLR